MIIMLSDHERKALRRIFATEIKKPAHRAPETVKKPHGINKACISSITDKKADTENIERVSGTVEEAPKKRQSKKQDFFISVYDKKAGSIAKKVTGHILFFEGLEIGLHRFNDKDYYIITDILTGLSMGECKTIKDAFTKITPEIMEIVKKAHVYNGTNKKQLDMIRAAYAEENSLPFC